MLADFCRMLFHKTRCGVYYTVALNDEIREKTLHLIYLGAGAKVPDTKAYPVDYVVVGDYEKDTLIQTKNLVEKYPVKTVLLPDGDSAKEVASYLKNQQVEEIKVVDECLCLYMDRWCFRFETFCGANGVTLVMYQGFYGADPSYEDCVYTTKMYKEANCIPYLYGNDDYCGFGCLRNRDFDVLKGHKRKGSSDYRMGTLILGTMQLKGQVEKLEKMLEGIEDNIRCICLPHHLTKDTYEEGFLPNLQQEDYLYVVNSGEGAPPEIVGELVGNNSFAQYRRVTEEVGFCASGYRIPYKNTIEK